MPAERPKLSVVVATFNRPALIERLLEQLVAQSLPASEFEVVVVDDGSREPVKPRLVARTWPFALRVEEQANAGQATARHRGILAAAGEVLVIVDDDMEVGPGFLAAHLSMHAPGSQRVVLGRIRPPPGGMSLQDRWHQRNLDRLHERARAGVPVRGNAMYTGNVSLRRTDYLAVGGFDTSLRQSEDSELGRRLERYGAEFVLSEEAYTVNGSDHTSVAKWRRQARNYGRSDLRISRKNSDLEIQHRPWDLNPVLAFAAFAPPLGMALAPVAFAFASALDRLGLERPAMAAVTVTYGVDYYRGVREELGSMGAVFRDFVDWWLDPVSLPAARKKALLRRFLSAVAADHATIRRYQDKYNSPEAGSGSLVGDAVKKIGFQLMLSVRFMHLLRDAGLRLPAMAVSRLIRHAYGSDIHWDADIAPGVVIIHGMGLAVSRAARIGPGCIIFQNVTLGLGNDPATRQEGAPALGRDVHVGPGCTLIGPIAVGDGTKLMAGSVLNASVPPRSIVAPAPVEVRTREARVEAVPAAPARQAGGSP
ncbi:MAG TPA: glycosyltransferase [Anaeromyxobacteraceae bacterium]|nr:glycosyltransferase [Anaeromyxobacteraceae bacterium]